MSRQHILSSSLYLRPGPVPCPQHQWDGPYKILIKNQFLWISCPCNRKNPNQNRLSNTQLFIDLPTYFKLLLGKVITDGKWFFFFWTVQIFYSERFYHLTFSVHFLVHHEVPKVRRKTLIKIKYIFILYINILYTVFTLDVRANLMENVSLFEAHCPRPLVVLHSVPCLGLASKSHLPFQPLRALLIHYPKVNHMHALTKGRAGKCPFLHIACPLLSTSLAPLNCCHFGLSLFPKEAFKSSMLWKPRANPLFWQRIRKLDGCTP